MFTVYVPPRHTGGVHTSGISRGDYRAEPIVIPAHAEHQPRSGD